MGLGLVIDRPPCEDAARMLAEGSTFAGYRIEGLAGRGGMGVVYRATQLGLNRTVALKLLAAELAQEPGFRARFERESQLAASIDHPNVVPVYEAGEFEGHLFISMRFVEGTDLKEMIAREGRLAPARAVAFTSQIAAALDAAHRRGLVHRDVKPANVLISEQDDHHAYLTDFGLIKHVSTATGLTGTGQWVGTLDYIAPEQIMAESIDGRADVYGLGGVLMHMLTGAPPFPDLEDPAKIFAQLQREPPLPSERSPEVPPALDEVVARALAKDPDERYASAGELAAAARAALEGGSGDATAARGAPVAAHRGADATVARRRPPATAAGAGPGTTEQGAVPTRRRLLPALGILAAIAIAGVVVALTAGGGEDDADDAPREAARTAAAQAAPIASIEVGREPSGIAIGAGGVWVANTGDGTLTRLDPTTNEAVGEPIEAGRDPTTIAIGRNVVWVTVPRDGAVRRIEGGDRPVPVSSLDVGGRPTGISIGPQLVWVTSAAAGTTTRIDRAAAQIVGSGIGIGDDPRSVHVGKTAVWIANAGDGTVSRVDISTAEVVGAPIRVGASPVAVLEASGFTWVANQGDGTVSRIDVISGEPEGEPVRVGQEPSAIAAGAGSIWVANAGDNTVTRLDPQSGRVLGRAIPVGREPRAIAVGEGSVWTANAGDGTVTRIDPSP